jgi:hypothetical protein
MHLNFFFAVHTIPSEVHPFCTSPDMWTRPSPVSRMTLPQYWTCFVAARRLGGWDPYALLVSTSAMEAFPNRSYPSTPRQLGSESDLGTAPDGGPGVGDLS